MPFKKKVKVLDVVCNKVNDCEAGIVDCTMAIGMLRLDGKFAWHLQEHGINAKLCEHINDSVVVKLIGEHLGADGNCESIW